MKWLTLNKTIVCKLFVVGLCAGLVAPSAAQAYSIALIPSTLKPAVNTDASFNLVMDFSGETTLGGGIDIVYSGFTDGVGLRFVGYAPIDANAAEYTSPDGLTPTPLSGKLLDLAFGYPTTSANFFSDLPFDPAKTVGILKFHVLAAGHYTLSVSETTDPNGTVGFDSSTNGSHLNLVNVPVSVDAQASGDGGGVSVPMTAWLLHNFRTHHRKQAD